MTSTREAASSCAFRGFFISAPAVSAPIATTYRSLAMRHSPVPVDTPSLTLYEWLTRECRLLMRKYGAIEPGAEGVQDVVDRGRAGILDAPRALAEARGTAAAADHVDRREHPGRARR